MKLDAYIDLNVFIEVQLIVENIICAVFAAVKKTKHHKHTLNWQLTG